MESCAFASLCHRAGIRGAVVCVTLIDRLHSDLMSVNDVSRYDGLVRRPQALVMRFIKREIGMRMKETRKFVQPTSTPATVPPHPA